MKLLDTLLLIGGPDSNRPILRELFQESYNLLEADSVEQGLFLLETNQECIVTVIVDRPPPKEGESTFLGRAQEAGLSGEIPILVILPTGSSQSMEELAFSLGATDVIHTPFSSAVIHRRVELHVQAYQSHQALLSSFNRQAETLRHSNEIMVDALSAIIEYRSAEAGSHTLRIRRFTEILLKEVAATCPEYELTPDKVQIISSAAALHDIGKISIPDHILNKPAALTPEEMAIMHTHTVNGSQIIQTLSGATNEEYLRYAYNICRSHHERYNGGGYPDGLVGEDIPICAQVVSLADAYDALTTDRVYKKAIPPTEAVNMILNGDCGRFSTKILTCFKRVVHQFIDLSQDYRSGRSSKSDAITLPLPGPTVPDHAVSSLQISQLKYQTLLHYTDATVVELDIKQGIFHMVYNPIPNFQPIPQLFPLEKALDAAALNHVHPEDVEKSRQEYNFLMHGFFDYGLRKHSFSHRLYSPALGSYREYQVTILRLDTGDAKQKKALLVWKPMTPLPTLYANDREIIRENKALLQLMSSVICCRCDHDLTISSGSSNLLDLLGYSSLEIQDQFQGCLIHLILPEDQDSFRDAMAQGLKKGVQIEAEFRMRHKDGHILWVLNRSCVITGDDGEEYFYSLLIDNSKSHAVQEELTEALQRNQLIIDQSDNVIFEWDLQRETVSLSPHMPTDFARSSLPPILREDMLSSSRIHPDDLNSVRNVAKRTREGAKGQEAEIRIANNQNRYVWFRLRMSALRNEAGDTVRVMGSLTDIDATKRSYIALQAQAQRDSLTGLLNKASTHTAIREHLASQHEGGSALLMIDLDNFKGINDRFGHLFGDTVLSRTAQAIRKLFRSGDIIGRVGGDEFMVYMKDILNRSLVQERCEELLQQLGSLFHEDSAESVVTCSVGVALSPEHGNAFQALYQRADQALYHSKKSGKHCYTIFQENLDMTIDQFSSTPIDSNEQPGLANSSLVRAVFRQLAHSTNVEQTIQEVLSLVGQRTNVSRVYIFENNDANTHCSNTFEWCNEGISPEIDNLQNLSYETDIPGWEDNYDENDLLFCPDIAQLAPGPRAILEPQGVKSMLHCAIRENGVFRGYIGLDECVNYRTWTKEQVDILTFLSEVVANFLMRKRAEDRANARVQNLRSLLGVQRNWTYVIDPNTHQLLYMNDKTRDTVPELQLGDVCHKAIMGNDTPCPGCPVGMLNCNGYAKSSIFSRAVQSTVMVDADEVIWDGKRACLITCREPDDV